MKLLILLLSATSAIKFDIFVTVIETGKRAKTESIL